ncbi:hypothetical protein [Maioricimonas sp. JC845]|uniref:hypothetical protein n=1 Tax=Maioricimonas sp. JC845 TaxID=3232138 RepID=UPI0034589E10
MLQVDRDKHSSHQLRLAAGFAVGAHSQRIASLQTLRGLTDRMGDALTICGYHDFGELPVAERFGEA